MEDGAIFTMKMVFSLFIYQLKIYFLNVVKCGSNKKTAKYCKIFTEKSVNIAEENYNAKLILDVIHNENKMNKLLFKKRLKANTAVKKVV